MNKNLTILAWAVCGACIVASADVYHWTGAPPSSVRK